MTGIFGAFLLAFIPAFLGFSAARQLNKRAAVLRELIRALEQLEREISFRLTPMPDLLAQLAEQYAPPVGSFFARCRDGMEKLGEQSMAQIWQCALADGRLDLEERQLRAIEELGRILGRYGESGVESGVERVRMELTSALVQADEKRKTQGRMDRVLGLTTAGAVLILLL